MLMTFVSRNEFGRALRVILKCPRWTFATRGIAIRYLTDPRLGATWTLNFKTHALYIVFIVIVFHGNT